MKVKPSTRGEVIAFAALVMTALIWFGQDRQDKGAAQKALDLNMTLLAQRNREVDVLERRLENLERRCNP